MTEILEDNILEQELCTHYQREFGPLLDSVEMWTRVSPLLAHHMQTQSPGRRWLASLRTLFSSSTSLERRGSSRVALRVSRPAAIMMASMACFIILSGFAFATLNIGPELQRLFNLDPGIKQLSLMQQFTQYNQTQKVAGHTITLSAAFADSNNVIVAYQTDLPLTSAIHTIHTMNQDSLNPFSSKLSINNSQELASTEALSNAATLSDELSAQIKTFDGSTIRGNPHSLALTLTLLYGHPVDDGNPVVGNPVVPNWHKVTFHFTVPFHPGRILTLHQSVFAHGETLTLDHAVITPSETRFYLSGDANFQKRWEKAVTPLFYPPYLSSSSLHVGKQLYNQSYNSEQIVPEWRKASNVTVDHITSKGIPISPTNLSLSYTLPAAAQHGDWTLIVQIRFSDCSNASSCRSSSAEDWYKYLTRFPAETWTFHIHA